MASVGEMEREAALPEPGQHGEAPVTAVDVETVKDVVAQAIAAHLPPRRAPWQSVFVGALLAGLIALAGVAYSTLRSDMTAMRSEMRSEIGVLRSEMREGFSQVNAVLLDHTERLARLEAAAGLPRANG